MRKKKTVFVYTDGSCSGNPGPGGWCAMLKYKGNEKIISGGEDYTTNNRMELAGVVNALRALKEPCEVIVTCDSRYVVDAIIKGWLVDWKARGWRKSNKKPAQNVDLWEQMLVELKKHDVFFNNFGREVSVTCLRDESPILIVKYLKGISGNTLLKEFPEIRKSLWKGQLWNGSYFCETIGSTSKENILRYIERQKNCQL